MSKIIAFILGTGVGSLVTWKIIERRYKQIADEEIASVIDRFRNRDILKPLIVENEKKTDDEKIEYNDKIINMKYSTNEPLETPARREIFVTPDGEEEEVEPYVITPDEYGEVDIYDTKCWTYYADFVLEDETGAIVSDPEKYIGDGLSHFGEYADNSVFVRNENIECDYEILKHDRTFAEINGGIMDDDTV